MTDFIRFTAGGRTFKVELADTPAARAFRKVLPAKLPMLELNGNEKYFHFRTVRSRQHPRCTPKRET